MGDRKGFFHSLFKRNKRENKAKLEHKLYLARETPEAIFDLSECGLLQVPPGIYSLCRVFLKESLILRNNNLTSLNGGGNLKDLYTLKVLDLQNNMFSVIPEEIHFLKNLEELYLNNNQLKKLPQRLNTLEHLKILNLSNNYLRVLPDNIGTLSNLRSLHLDGNKGLKKLPQSICCCTKLSKITLDSMNLLYPPSQIALQGTEAIIKFICDDSGRTYVPPADVLDSSSTCSGNEAANEDDESFQAKIRLLEKLKEQKAQEFLEMERNNELLQKQEVELANAQKANKQKLLEDISEQQQRLDKELLKVQQDKDAERFKLIEQLKQTEDNADVAIKKLLELNREPLVQILEQEREAEARMLKEAEQHSIGLRKNDILAAMQELLEQETKRFKKLNEIRNETARNILEMEMQSDTHLAEILQNKDLHQSELVTKLQEDNELQKIAVGALLERGDARSWSLIQQVRLVESQLAALTLIEIDRKKLEMSEQINDLAEKRFNLSMLLTDLLDQQNCRRTQLLSTLKNLEISGDTALEDFWLKQYQQLLDRLPSGLAEAQKNMNPNLAESLLIAGVIHCLPFLAKWASESEEVLLNVSEEDLISAGIIKSEDRKRILEAFRCYKKTMDEKPLQSTSDKVMIEEATAPPENTFMSSECVVCMDSNCQVIFVPCGHYCCCLDCSGTLVECPMCRGIIDRKVRVIF